MKHKNVLKGMAAALAVVGVCTGLFDGATSVFAASSLSQVHMVPTAYPAPVAAIQTKKESAKDTKMSYHIQMDKLNTGIPTAADLTMEEAGALGMEYLAEIFLENFEGAYVHMSYNPGTVTFPRAFWSGDVVFSTERGPESTRGTFFLDAVTGELFNIGFHENLTVQVPLGLDRAIEKDSSLYAGLVRENAERLNLMSGGIAEITYGGQGYAGNNPLVTMQVLGKNGEVVQMTFSRYDQKLTGIITDASRRISEAALQKLMEKEESDSKWEYTTVIQVEQK